MVASSRPESAGESRPRTGLSGREWRWNGWLIGAVLCVFVIGSGIYNYVRFRVSGDVPWGNSADDMTGGGYLSGMAVWVIAAVILGYVGVRRLPLRSEHRELSPTDRGRLERALQRIPTAGPTRSRTPAPDEGGSTARVEPTRAGAAANPGSTVPEEPLSVQAIRSAMAQLLADESRRSNRREIMFLVIGTVAGAVGPTIMGQLPGLIGR